MAKKKRKKTVTRPRDEAGEKSQLNRHIRALGLTSAGEYKDWCRKRGLSTGLLKSGPQRDKERGVAQRMQGQAAQVRMKQHTRRPQNTIVRIYRREIQKGGLGADYLQKIRTLFAAFEDDTVPRRALLDLLLHVERYASNLFRTDPAIPHLGSRWGNTYLDGLSALVCRQSDWIRTIEAWKPASHNPRRQFSSLARHLLCQYDVPVFMDAAWMGGNTDAVQRQQDWFQHVGSGGNIRTADIPVHLTKMMAHRFLQTPDDISIEHAFRRAQVVGQEGSKSLANAVIHSRLGISFEHEDFWSSVIQFLVHQPMLDPACVGPIADYIHNQKYIPEEIIQPGGIVIHGDPPQADFSMKGRSITRILQQIETWHEQLAEAVYDPDDPTEDHARKGRVRYIQWENSGFRELSYHENKKKSEDRLHWTIQELLSNRELTAEGKEMHHCVASYAKNCRSGNTSIWSLRVREPGRIQQTILTIAVDNRTRSITQIRGRYNILPGGKTRDKHQGDLGSWYQNTLSRSPGILQRWIDQEGLIRAY